MIALLARLLEAPLAVPDVPLEPRDAIVVLGAPLAPGDVLTSYLEERVVVATALFRAGAGARIVTTGGVTRPRRGALGRMVSRIGADADARSINSGLGRAHRAEAEALADGLVAAGVPRDAIVVEARAQTTAENARFTAALLAPLGARTVWLVTQPFHAKRAARLFARAGLEPRIWHIADSIQYRDRRRALRWLTREYAAWAKYFVTRS